MYLFIDETGELNDFSPSGSIYFGLCGALMPSLSELHLLHELRLLISGEGFDLPKRGFHSKFDPMPRRYRVCETIGSFKISSKEDVHVVFAKFNAGESMRKVEQACRAAAAVAKKRADFTPNLHCHFWHADYDLGLQIADYAAWTTLRHLERPDDKSSKCVMLFGKTLKDPFELFTQ